MKFIPCLSFALLSAGLAHADFDPIPLTPGSFNQDVVVEKTATPPGGRSTTASMDSGTNNTGGSWYEVGYNTSAPATGIPNAGSTFTHATFADHSYQMAPSYTAPNALLIAPGQVTNGTLQLSAPAAYATLSLLAAGGNSGITMNYTVHFDDDTTQTGSVVIGDWFNGTNPAWTANGRVNVGTFTFDNVNNNNPRLNSYDITISNPNAAITSVDFAYASGTGRSALLALSGNVIAGGIFTPIGITGYNYDMVVENAAPQAGALRNATTASMDGGTNNNNNTWFERGYDPVNTNSGLPEAGTTITSIALADHHYMMPASYAGLNAVLVDSNTPVANLTLQNPMPYSALSFLSATANGTVTNQCIMQYADGTSETNTFLSRDWFNNTPYAYTSSGRVNLNDRTFNNIGTSNPRLYEAQFALGNTASAITNVVLKWIGGAGNSRAVVLAVSGTAGSVAPIINSQPQAVGAFEGNSASLSAIVVGTPPLHFQWQKNVNGVFVDVTDDANVSGATTTNLAFAALSQADGLDYRLVITNIGGATTSSVARVTALSLLPDITAPGDVITAVGGTTPPAETPDHAIDNLMQKYLNYGSGTNVNLPPFAGPVGLVITPAAGSTLVTGLRIYTANDGVERDPTDFSLEGSVDGGNTYTLIASNALSLPDGRNGASADPVSPTNQTLQQVLFNNANGYTTYRLMFYHVKNATLANSMQIGEVELLGRAVPLISIRRENDGTVTITSSRAGTLQTTTELKGAETVWEDFGPIEAGDANGQSMLVSPGEIRFFRVVQP